MATLILAGSKPTTAPFLRITLYSAYAPRAAASTGSSAPGARTAVALS